MIGESFLHQKLPAIWYTVTYLDSTDDKVRGIERNENDHQNQHQVKIQLPMKVSRTGGDGERDKEQAEK